MSNDETIQPNIRLGHELLALEAEDDVDAMLELVVPEVVSVVRPPLHLALVIDRSGSMAGPKLDAAKAAAAYIARRLTANDKLAIVTYDDAVQLVVPLGAVTNADALDAVIATIDSRRRPKPCPASSPRSSPGSSPWRRRTSAWRSAARMRSSCSACCTSTR